jgi:hypothetical protein
MSLTSSALPKYAVQSPLWPEPPCTVHLLSVPERTASIVDPGHDGSRLAMVILQALEAASS